MNGTAHTEASSQGFIGSSQGFIGSIRSMIDQELNQPVHQRDPEYILRYLPLVERAVKYFRPEVRGYENVPDGEQVLLVGNHSGGLYTPEMYVFMASWLRERGLDHPTYGLAHNMIFATPARTFLRKMGAIPASVRNAERTLELGASLMVYPGGDHEAFRPWWHRHRIDFDGRKGFVRLALRRRLKVVPVVSHGSHESTIVVARGKALARMMKLERLNVKIFPFVLAIPWGVVPGFVPSIPLPSKITVELNRALDWRHHGPEAADDPEIVQQCYDEIVANMQGTLDRLVKERPFPLLS
jgi:1-acyl-sn-glycerol-3-phosphate acyltransferase